MSFRSRVELQVLILMTLGYRHLLMIEASNQDINQVLIKGKNSVKKLL